MNQAKLLEALKGYADGRLSQGRAAEIAGMTRAEFIDVLSRHRICPFQYTAEELDEELLEVDGGSMNCLAHAHKHLK